MDQQNVIKMRVGKFLVFFLTVISIFFIAKTVNEFKTGALIGRSGGATNIITVSGKGEVLAVPDVATFTYSVTEESKLVADAQKMATDKSNKVIDFLKSKNIDAKDIKTTGYNINPKYEYSSGVCNNFNCAPSKQILTGYEVTQSVEVKVRKIDQAGDVIAGIGGLGVQNLSGLNLSVDNQDALVKDARTKAIADARADADRIAKDLGVSVVRVISFVEEGQSQPPMMYAKESMAMGANDAAAPAPQIQAGENKITSNVSVTYEIR